MNLSLVEKAAAFAAKRRALGIVAVVGASPIPVQRIVVPVIAAPLRPSTRATASRMPSRAIGARANAPPISQPLVTARETWKTIKGATELDLISRFQAGDRRAGDRLIKAHEPLVQSQSKGWIRWYPSAAEDILQEARMGFVRAIQSFDVSEDASLTTYAIYWIRHCVQRFIEDKLPDIRVPVHMRARLRAIGRAGSTPTSEAEIAGRVALQRLVRLDAAMDDSDGDRTFGDIVPSESQRPDALVTAAFDAEAWRNLFAKLSHKLNDRERRVIAMRFADEPLTLEQIAESEGVTREAIRMRETWALKKLRVAAQRVGIKFDDLWSTDQ